MPRTSKKSSMRKQRSLVKKEKIARPHVAAAAKPARKLSADSYKSFRLSKKLRHPGPKVTGSFRLTGRALKHVWQYKKLFGIIALTYLVLNLLFVRGFIFTADITEVKEAVSELFSGSAGQIAGSLTVMGLLVNSLNPQTEVAVLYQTILVTLFSLCVIWALRQTYAGDVPKVKDVFYRSSYPLVQFIIVIFIIGLQLLPLVLANFLYAAVVVSGVAITFPEVFSVSILIFLLVVWSLYMVTVSVFALYIVALPDMTPLKALRSARGLVHYRRWTVMRKVLFLPIGLLAIGSLVMLPVILLVPMAAEAVFLIGSAFMLPLVHSYMYSLYRELLA